MDFNYVRGNLGKKIGWMFTEHSFKVWWHKILFFQAPFFFSWLQFMRQMAGRGRARRILAQPLYYTSSGILLFQIWLQLGRDLARLRPRVQMLSWLHISAVIKLTTRQNRLYVWGSPYCMYLTSEILPATTCWRAQRELGGENMTFSV